MEHITFCKIIKLNKKKQFLNTESKMKQMSYFCFKVWLKYRKRNYHKSFETSSLYIATLAWKIPQTEEPGRLQSTGSQRVRLDWVTSLSLFTFIGEGNGNPLQCSCLENPRDGGAWWAAVYGVAQSQTWLKWLSSSSMAYNGEGNGTPLQYSCLENPMDGGAW